MLGYLFTNIPPSVQKNLRMAYSSRLKYSMYNESVQIDPIVSRKIQYSRKCPQNVWKILLFVVEYTNNESYGFNGTESEAKLFVVAYLCCEGRQLFQSTIQLINRIPTHFKRKREKKLYTQRSTVIYTSLKYPSDSNELSK